MGYLLGAIFLVVSAANMAILLGWFVSQKHGTLIPLLGGLAGVGACLTLPIPALAQWCFVPLILDAGSIPLLLLTGDFLLRELFKDFHGARH